MLYDEDVARLFFLKFSHLNVCAVTILVLCSVQVCVASHLQSCYLSGSKFLAPQQYLDVCLICCKTASIVLYLALGKPLYCIAAHKFETAGC